MSKQEICDQCGVAKEIGEECPRCAAIPPISKTPEPTASDKPRPNTNPVGNNAANDGPTKEDKRKLRQKLHSGAWHPNETTGPQDTESDEPEAEEGEPGTVLENKRKVAILAAAIALLLLLIAGGWWWLQQSPTQSAPPNTPSDQPAISVSAGLTPEHEHAIAAHYHCQERVKAELKNPYSASFPATDYDAKRQGDGSFLVKSYVDESTATDQVQRRNWLCRLRYTEDATQATMDVLYHAKNWELLRMSFQSEATTK